MFPTPWMTIPASMMCVELVVEVPFCSAVAAPAPPIAWITRARMSKEEKIMMYHIGLSMEFALPTIFALEVRNCIFEGVVTGFPS